MSGGERLRRKTAWRLVKLGGWLSDALTALSVAIDPTLFPLDAKLRTRSLWPGLAVVFIIILALVSAGQAVSWAIREAAPHREVEHAGR